MGHVLSVESPKILTSVIHRLLLSVSLTCARLDMVEGWREIWNRASAPPYLAKLSNYLSIFMCPEYRDIFPILLAVFCQDRLQAWHRYPC